MMRWILFLAVLASLQQSVLGAERCDCVKSGDDVDCRTNYAKGCDMRVGVAVSVLKAGTFDGMKVNDM